MVSLVMRALTMFFGYIYPAYECYKSIEKNKRDVEEQTFWCQYWVLIAVVTFAERITDVLVSWLPLYNEAKLAFIVYLWYPKTKGTNYIYSTCFKPFVANYEPEIDRRLAELRAQAAEMACLLWQRVSLFTQEKFYEVVHCLASRQLRLQAYRRHLPQIQPANLQPLEALEPPASTYYIQEEAEEAKDRVPAKPPTVRSERDSTSLFFRTTTRISSRQQRATFVRAG